jgi:hypothetical protein
LLQKRRQVLTAQPTDLALNVKHCEPGSQSPLLAHAAPGIPCPAVVHIATVGGSSLQESAQV